MLTELKIENFALARNLEVSFGRGLNVITGESGAGKSLVVDSLSFVLGERIKSARFSGDETVRVQGVFEIEPPGPEIMQSLIKEGIIESECEPLILMRKFTPQGRSSYHINGQMVPLKTYRELGESLVDIHGQKDSQFLLKSANQRQMVDLAGGGPLESVLQNVQELHRICREKSSALNELKTFERERLRQMDWLRFEIEEIRKACLTPGEDTELQRKKAILTNAEKITRISAFAHQALSGENGAADSLNAASGELTKWARYDSRVEPYLKMLESALESVNSASAFCRDEGEECRFDQQKLDEVVERIHLIDDLKRKYGPAIEDVVRYMEESQSRLKNLSESEEKAAELEQEIDEIKTRWSAEAEKLSALRKTAAESLTEAIVKELSDLGMEGALFNINVTTSGGDSGDGPEVNSTETSANGPDQVEFVISANPGEPLKPLSLIASGGELSRVMLALKNVFARFRDFSTLVLDEIDVGIGGITAGNVAVKMKEIAAHRQVISITHLPVIAAMADFHYQIEKTLVDGSAVTELKPIGGNTRIDEVARMIAGESAPGETRKVAKKLLKGNV